MKLPPHKIVTFSHNIWLQIKQIIKQETIIIYLPLYSPQLTIILFQTYAFIFK